MPIMVHEILEKASEAKSKKEKIAVLHEHNCLALRDILRGAYDDLIEFILPEGEPPYEKDDAPAGYSRSSLMNQTRKFRYFVKGGPGERVNPLRREKMFIEILESVHPQEAELVVLMKNKKLNGTYKGITKKLVQEAFPNLIKK